MCWGDNSEGQRGAAPAITSAPLPATGANQPYSHTVTATGSPTPTFAVTRGLAAARALAQPRQRRDHRHPHRVRDYTGTISASDGVFADATQPFSIMTDIDAPATTDNVPGGFVNHAVTVTLTAADTGGSGVAQTHYTTDGTAPTTASPTYDAGSKPVLTNGQRIKYFSVDDFGQRRSGQDLGGGAGRHRRAVDVDHRAGRRCDVRERGIRQRRVLMRR